MKERKMIKRFGAAFTAFAVVSSLGSLAVFADEEAAPDISIEITEDDVTSVEDALQADIKKILPEEENLDPIAQTAEAGNVSIDKVTGGIVGDNVFRINVEYSGVAEGAQTTWMAYKADAPTTPLGDLEIEYVNQDVTASSVTFYVKSEADVLDETNIAQEPNVVIKIGGTNAAPAATVVEVSKFEFVQGTPGDIDGNDRINISDVIAAYEFANGTEADEAQRAAADVDGNGRINITDVILIYNRANGDTTPFPVE